MTSNKTSKPKADWAELLWNGLIAAGVVAAVVVKQVHKRRTTEAKTEIASDGVSFVPDGANAEEIERFWHQARAHFDLGTIQPVTGVEWANVLVPPAWAFGGDGDVELANDLLKLIQDGRKTATASALWEYGPDDAQPQKGELSIILDGFGKPQAVIRTTSVEIVPFNEVTAKHAYHEGEGERTLASWRRDHEGFWRGTLPADKEFSETMPVICETFEVLYPK